MNGILDGIVKSAHPALHESSAICVVMNDRSCDEDLAVEMRGAMISLLGLVELLFRLGHGLVLHDSYKRSKVKKEDGFVFQGR
jgi:hypothetical protein